MQFLANLIVQSLAVIITARFLPGVHIDGYVTAITVAVALAIVNMLIKPLLIILTLPLTILTLGLFTFVINGLLVLLVSQFVPGFRVDGLLTAIIFSLILALLGAVLRSITGT